MTIKIAAAAAVLLFTSSSIQASDKVNRPARHGVADFSETEISSKDMLSLDGTWKFFWHEFISPTGAPPRDYGIDIPVRGTWKGVVYAGSPLPAEGWGSYELLLLLGKRRGELSLKIPNVGTAYRLYANGELIAEQGKPAMSATESAARTVPVLARLPAPDTSGRILLIMHVSNYQDRHGGIWQTLRLGESAHMQSTVQNEYALSVFLAGAIFLIGLYHFLMFLRRRSEISNLAFAVLCFLLALRSLVEGNRYLMVLLPDFPWIWNSRFAYLTFYAAVPFAAWFLRLVFPQQFGRWALITVLVVSIPACIVVIALPPRWYTETLAAFQLFSLLMILYSLTAIVRAVFAGQRGAKTLALGIGGLFAGATVDILTVANILNAPELAPFGLIGFILSQSVMLSIRQEDAYRRLEALAAENKELIESMELKIIERTATIAELSAEGDAVLNALNEGVFLINREQIIGNKFSQKITEILELDGDELVGQPFSQIILRITGENLSEDARLFLNVLFNAAMDDDMVDQLNPLRKIAIHGLKSQRQKIIDFSFVRQKRSSGIMGAFVSCRDITADEKLREELEEREVRANRQLEIVRTLFSVNPEALQAFYGSIENEIEDIDAAIAEESALDLRGRIEQVYRAVHTIKGSAQLFKIGFIADEANNFETKLQNMLSADALENLDMIAVNIGYASLQKALEEFEEMIRKILRFQREASGMHMSAVDVLRESLPKMVAEICDRLGKKAEITYDGFSAEMIPRRLAPALRDSLVQCVRNALAHSIEPPEERRNAGKNEVARILISARKEASGLVVTVRDDGRSFDVEAIRQRAVEHGLIRAESAGNQDDNDIINFIFKPGFSTAAAGGDYSGRGAGLDIVAKKIQRIQGKIRIAWARGQFTEFSFLLPRDVSFPET